MKINVKACTKYSNLNKLSRDFLCVFIDDIKKILIILQEEYKQLNTF